MSNETPKRDSLLSNPQVLAAVIGGIVTVIVAIIGVVPALVRDQPTATPQPTVVIVTATPAPTSAADSVMTPAVPAETSPTVTSLSSSVVDSSPAPTNLPISQPNSTLVGSNILLLYDEVSFTLRNQSDKIVSLEGVSFSSASGQWEGRSWGPSVYNSIAPGKCLRLRDATVGQRQPPAPCRDQILGLQEVGTSALFWIGVATFDVLRGGQVIAACQTAEASCLISI